MEQLPEKVKLETEEDKQESSEGPSRKFSEDKEVPDTESEGSGPAEEVPPTNPKFKNLNKIINEKLTKLPGEEKTEPLVMKRPKLEKGPNPSAVEKTVTTEQKGSEELVDLDVFCFDSKKSEGICASADTAKQERHKKGDQKKRKLKPEIAPTRKSSRLVQRPSLNEETQSEDREAENETNERARVPARQSERNAKRQRRSLKEESEYSEEESEEQDKTAKQTRQSGRSRQHDRPSLKEQDQYSGDKKQAAQAKPTRQTNRTRKQERPSLKEDSESSEEESEAEETRAVRAKPSRQSERTRNRGRPSLKEHSVSTDEGTSGNETEQETREQVIKKVKLAVKASAGKSSNTPLVLDESSDEGAPVEKILCMQGDKFFVKYKEKSYRETRACSKAYLQKQCPPLLQNFLKKMAAGEPGLVKEDSEELPYPSEYGFVERIIASRKRGKKTHYLVKWCGLPYASCTWESEEALQEDIEAVERFVKDSTPRGARQGGRRTTLVFKDGRKLRDYQEEGVRWLEERYRAQKCCILGDEMGLGKTFQSVAILESLRVKRGIDGPFLVVAPVSTIGHWAREFQGSTDMYCVVYTGSGDDRSVIRDYEFKYPSKKSRKFKFHVLLTSYEIMIKDKATLSKISWEYIVVDEAHRLKSRSSKLSTTLREFTHAPGGLLLLTGTPVQNNLQEIFGLLSVLDPKEFPNESAFSEKYGDIVNGNAEQVAALQEVLRPRLLRRMKEDVEKSIPDKEEVIVWVELTREQRAYYKAIYEQNIEVLLRGAKNNKDIPNLRNVAMELRKLCNHPFLCDGLENDILRKRWSEGEAADRGAIEHAALRQCSGKMVFLDKLLAKLHKDGHRVLIFSQFTKMLDVIEDYLHQQEYKFERIDGKIRGSDRQAAIDRFSKEGSDGFVFLLSTKAGGVGINLTAADTCVIFDSDWNPQNDLQAMARCHRIGQDKDVKVYRLITKSTYEEQLFKCASKKFGLDEAILGDRMGQDRDPENGKEIESLLKNGAYDLFKDEKETDAVKFNEEDIDQILEKRTEKRKLGSTGKSSFSVATFTATENMPAEPVEGPSFWKELLPEACAQAAELAAAAQVEPVLAPRKRRRVNYQENPEAGSSPEDSDSDSGRRKRGRSRKGSSEESDVHSDSSEEEADRRWTTAELKRLEDALLSLGLDRTEQVRTEAALPHQSLADVDDVSKALVAFWTYFQKLSEEGRNSPASSRPASATLALPAPQGGMENGQPPLGSDQPVQGTAGRASLEGAKLEHPVVPPVARKAFGTRGFRDRAQRVATKNLQTLHERKVLADVTANWQEYEHQLYNWAFTLQFAGKNLPLWWDIECDKSLLLGAHRHGHRKFELIKNDPDLVFTNKLKEEQLAIEEPPGPIINSSEPEQSQDFSSWSVSQLKAYLQEHNVNPALYVEKSELLAEASCVSLEAKRREVAKAAESIPELQAAVPDWPSDQVLQTRLKRLIECLPGGVSPVEQRRRDEAKRRAAEKREAQRKAAQKLADLKKVQKEEERKDKKVDEEKEKTPEQPVREYVPIETFLPFRSSDHKGQGVARMSVAFCEAGNEALPRTSCQAPALQLPHAVANKENVAFPYAKKSAFSFPMKKKVEAGTPVAGGSKQRPLTSFFRPSIPTSNKS